MSCLVISTAVHCMMSTCGKIIEKHKNSLTMCIIKVLQRRFVLMRKTSTTQMMDMDSLRNNIPDVTYDYCEF